MYSIISPVPFRVIRNISQRYKEELRNKDFYCDEFFKSEIGKELLAFHPMRIRHNPNRTIIAQRLGEDIAYMSLTYNCKLYICFIKESSFLKELRLPYDFANYGTFNNLLPPDGTKSTAEHNQQIRIDPKTSYFNGEYDVCISSAQTLLKSVSFKEETFYEFILKPGKGFSKK